MSKSKIRLGRGLDALLNPNVKEEVESPITIPTSEIGQDDGNSYNLLAKLPINSILPNPFQPRKEFDSGSIEELKKSILENGLIQPITVRRTENKNYELISGERRLRACKAIGYKEIPAYIIKVDTKEAMLALSLIENIQRENLNPIELANAFKRLMNECNLSQEEIAVRVGKERSTITNAIRLLKLPETIQENLIKGEISSGHARAIINVQNETFQKQIVKKIIENGLSVRKVEELVKKLIKSPSTSRNLEHANKDFLHISALNDVEARLREILGTKVKCRQRKNGSGELLIEFYSSDELERLFELFEIIKNSNL